MFVLTIRFQLPCRFYLEFPKGVFIDVNPIIVSKSLLFIDDTKIYNVASNSQDTTALQRDLDSATLWSERWDIYFNPTKSIHH